MHVAEHPTSVVKSCGILGDGTPAGKQKFVCSSTFVLTQFNFRFFRGYILLSVLYCFADVLHTYSFRVANGGLTRHTIRSKPETCSNTCHVLMVARWFYAAGYTKPLQQTLRATAARARTNRRKKKMRDVLCGMKKEQTWLTEWSSRRAVRPPCA